MKQLRTLCVMGTFGNQFNEEIYRIEEKMKIQGITIDAYEPHISFGIYTKLNDADLLKWISTVALQHKRIQIYFNHFGFFPDSRLCFIAPCSNYNLLELHSDIHREYDTCCTDKGCLYSLQQKNWTPHMTIASVDPGQEQSLLSILWEGFSPLTGELTRLKVTSSDESQAIGSFDLQAL
ncbi:2'-5' RNA ligase superfamily protein [anaerobic digester metagenome]|uniref:2'-5' RNA ligase family protein n=1 Tax=Oscillibacter ruminantium TaxID=1263547 RepID=UPI001181B188|nr:2'-5' RNA ligase family protein [Oscillibacter ruminantium]